MHRHKFLRHAAALLAAAALLVAVVLAGGGSAGYTLHRRPGGGAENCLDALPDRKKAAGERGRGQHDA